MIAPLAQNLRAALTGVKMVLAAAADEQLFCGRDFKTLARGLIRLQFSHLIYE